MAGVGLAYQRLDWDDFIVDTPEKAEAIEHIKIYLNNPLYLKHGTGIIFFGKYGTGKTMLANLVIKEMVKRGLESYAATAADMIEAFTSGWTSDEEKRWFDRKFRYSKNLLLDDLGQEFKSKNALSATTFSSILRSRVQGGRPTIVTTNLTVDELQSGYGASALSLLREQSIDISFTGANFHEIVRARNEAQFALGEVRPIV